MELPFPMPEFDPNRAAGEAARPGFADLRFIAANCAIGAGLGLGFALLAILSAGLIVL